MKKLFIIKLVIFLALVLLAVSGCGETIQPTSTSIPTQTPSATLPPTLTPTPSPTLIPTPIPVTIQEAIQRGAFEELEVFNKGSIYLYSYVPSSSYRDRTIYLSTFTPDGKQFVAVTKRGIYAYDVDTWQELISIPLSPEVMITSTSYSVDSSLFAAGDSSGIVTFWDTKTWKIQNSFEVHKGAVTSLDISPDNMNFITIGDKKEISVWSIKDGSLIKSEFRSKVTGPAHYSLDGKSLYIYERRGDPRIPYSDLVVWNSENLKIINRPGLTGKEWSGQAVSPYTNTVAAHESGELTVYDFDKQEKFSLDWDVFLSPTQMMFLDEKTLMVKALRSHDYNLIDLESYDITTLSLEALSRKAFKNPEFLHILKSKEIKALGFGELGGIQNITPDGTALILSSGVFDLNQKALNEIAIQDFPWDSFAPLLDGSLAGVEPQGSEIAITILSLEPKPTIKSKVEQTFDVTDFIQAATISPSGKTLAFVTADGSLYLWNLGTKELTTKIKPFRAYVRVRLSFNKDGSYLAIAGQDGNIKVINMEDPSKVASYSGREPVFSPDGMNLAYVNSNGSIHLVSPFNKDEPKVFPENNDRFVSIITFSPDGTLLFSDSFSPDDDQYKSKPKMKVWLISDQTLLLDLPQYANLTSLIVSPDGTRLYVQSDGVISVWGHNPE
ncbi:MAG: hypothetical protein KPEEDBHJ_03058 [Anaerolineales bacterium]|nr:hypothetical protein [Anaerolineales bacterium]